MGTNLSNVSTGSKIQTSVLSDNDEKIEYYLNGEIKETDMVTGFLPGSPISEHTAVGLVQTNHIRPPNFFGAPAPRTELVSSDVHHRRGTSDLLEETFLWHGVVPVPDSTEPFSPVKGLAATIHVTPKTPGETVKAVVMASAYVREHSFKSGDGFAYASNPEESWTRHGKYAFGFLAMYHQTEDNSPYLLPGTHRTVYSGSSYTSRTRTSSTKSMSWNKVVDLQHGINHIFIGASVQSILSSTENARVGGRLWFSCMNFIVDVHYL